MDTDAYELSESEYLFCIEVDLTFLYSCKYTAMRINFLEKFKKFIEKSFFHCDL